MTHDELLADINKEIDEKAFIPERYYPTRYLIALRAVVELHSGNGISNRCVSCSHGNPCETIQVIEKELV